MGDYMNLEAINRRFSGEWVLIDQIRTDADRLLVGGRVSYHGKDYVEASRLAQELGGTRSDVMLFCAPYSNDLVWLRPFCESLQS